MLNALHDHIDRQRAMRVQRKSMYKELMAELPPARLPYWKKTAHLEFKGIPSDAYFFARAAEGLLNFFDCVRLGNRLTCGLPSKAADSVWHAWLQMDAAHLRRFCARNCDGQIDHVERELIPTGMVLAFGACLVSARHLQRTSSAFPSLPPLFLLDSSLRMPMGSAFARIVDDIYVGQLDSAGRRNLPLKRQPVWSTAGLLGAGLISEADFQAYTTRHEENSGTCTSVSGENGAGCNADADGADGADGGGGGDCGGGGGCGGCGGS